MAERVSKPPIRIQILNVINDFRKINELIIGDFESNSILINRFIQDIEMCLEQIKEENITGQN